MVKEFPFRLTGLEGFIMLIQHNTKGHHPLLDSGQA